MQVSGSRASRASAQTEVTMRPSRLSQVSISGTTKTFVLTPHQLMDISFALDATPIVIRQLQRNVAVEDVQLQVGDRLVSIAGHEVLESSGADVKNILLRAMQQSEVRVVFMSLQVSLTSLAEQVAEVSPEQLAMALGAVAPQERERLLLCLAAFPREDHIADIEEEDPLTEMEDGGEWRPATSEDLRRAAERLKQAEASQQKEKRGSVMLKAQSTVVRLDVKDDPQSSDAIKWGFDAEGAFLKRFSSKTTPSVETLQQLLREGARLQGINGTAVTGKSKEEILDVWHSASANGPLELSFDTKS